MTLGKWLILSESEFLTKLVNMRSPYQITDTRKSSFSFFFFLEIVYSARQMITLNFIQFFLFMIKVLCQFLIKILFVSRSFPVSLVLLIGYSVNVDDCYFSHLFFHCSLQIDIFHVSEYPCYSSVLFGIY